MSCNYDDTGSHIFDAEELKNFCDDGTTNSKKDSKKNLEITNVSLNDKNDSSILNKFDVNNITEQTTSRINEKTDMNNNIVKNKSNIFSNSYTNSKFQHYATISNVRPKSALRINSFHSLRKNVKIDASPKVINLNSNWDYDDAEQNYLNHYVYDHYRTTTIGSIIKRQQSENDDFVSSIQNFRNIASQNANQVYNVVPERPDSIAFARSQRLREQRLQYQNAKKIHKIRKPFQSCTNGFHFGLGRKSVNNHQKYSSYKKCLRFLFPFKLLVRRRRCMFYT